MKTYLLQLYKYLSSRRHIYIYIYTHYFVMFFVPLNKKLQKINFSYNDKIQNKYF